MKRRIFLWEERESGELFKAAIEYMRESGQYGCYGKVLTEFIFGNKHERKPQVKNARSKSDLLGELNEINEAMKVTLTKDIDFSSLEELEKRMLALEANLHKAAQEVDKLKSDYSGIEKKYRRGVQELKANRRTKIKELKKRRTEVEKQLSG